MRKLTGIVIEKHSGCAWVVLTRSQRQLVSAQIEVILQHANKLHLCVSFQQFADTYHCRLTALHTYCNHASSSAVL